MTDVFEKKEIQLDKRTKAVVEWMYDTDPDLSWLGDWTSKEHEYVIDRVQGVFLGKLKEFGDIEVPLSDLTSKLPLVDEDGTFTLDAWDAAQRHLEAKATELGMWFGDDDGLDVRFDDDKQVFYISDLYHYEVLAKDLGRTCYDSRREYRYWEPGENYIPHDPDAWEHVSAETKAEIIAKHGSLEQQDILYALEDWKRMEDYNNQGWFMSGCKATVYVDDIEVGESYGLWGIESDSDDGYKQEIEEEQIAVALDDARANAASYGKIARKLRSLNTDKLLAALKDAEAV